MNQLRTVVAVLALATGLSLNPALARDNSTRNIVLSERALCKHVLNGELFFRTELFFGLSRPDGVVTEEQFQSFIDSKVTPRFPDGLTLLSGKGQFRDSSGTIIQEGSKLLILLYPFTLQRSQAVEEIRTDYKTAFDQQSVLRVDEQSCVSF